MRARRFVPISLVLVLILALGAACQQAQGPGQPGPSPTPAGPAFQPPKDEIGVVEIKPGEPIVLAGALVIAGPDASLGTDSMRGIEIAIDHEDRFRR